MRNESQRSAATIAVAVVASCAVVASLLMFGVKSSRRGTVVSEECEDFSFIPYPHQTATISLPIVGSPFALSYASDRAPGRSIESSLDARPLGLGGWSLDVLHAYDVKKHVLVFGNGNRRLVEASPVTLKGTSALAVPSVEANEIYIFDILGRHLQTLDGITGAVLLQFAWTESGVATVTEAGRRVTQIRRDAHGVPIAIISARGYRTRLGTRNGLLAAVVDPSDHMTKITTRPDGLVTVIRDAEGGRTSMRYEADGRLAGIEGPAGATVTFKRIKYADGYTVKATTGAGRVWSVVVRRKGDRVFREYTDEAGRTAKVEVQGLSRFVTTSDGISYHFTLTKDPRWGAAAPVPSVEIRTPAGRRTTVTETREGGPINRELEPESNHRSLRVNGATWQVNYEPADRTIKRTGPGGAIQTVHLDEQGRPTLVERAGYAPTSYSYNAVGRIETITQGNGQDARQWRYEFDRTGGTVTVTDPLGRQRTVSSDAIGRPVRLDVAGEITRVGERDSLGRVTAFSSPGRSATRWTYRPDGRVDSIALPAGTEGLRYTTFGYDPDGIATSVEFADRGGMTIQRNGSGRIVAVNAGAEPWHVSYDKDASMATTFEGPGGRLERRFDGADIVTETWSGLVNSKINREFDGQSRVIADDVGGSSRVEYRYDGAGFLIQAGELSIDRDAVTGRILAERIGTLERTWRYNRFSEVIGSAVTAAGKPIYNLQVDRDKLGRVIERTERLPNSVLRSQTFLYDATNRLGSIRDNTRRTTYTYDSNGNLLREASGATEIAAEYDGRDELTHQGNAAFAYDAAARLSSVTSPAGKRIYEFDRAGHLLSVALSSGTKINYVIDGVGRRIGRSMNGRPANGYAYADGLRPAAELDTSGKVVSRFVYALPSLAPTYFVRGAKPYLVVTDEVGTPRLVLDAASGAVLETIDRDPWGRAMGDNARSSLPFGLAGGLADPDTGLVHFGARDYDPVAARWTAPDPMGLRGGDANRYRYASGDPVNRVDPAGTCDVLALGVSMGGGWGIVGSGSIGIVTGGTDLGGYVNVGHGGGTPGFGIAVEGTCLFEMPMEPGTSAPASPLDQFSGSGASTDLAGIAGTGSDLSYSQGRATLAGGHASLGIQGGASLQHTVTGVWCWTCSSPSPPSDDEIQRLFDRAANCSGMDAGLCDNEGLSGGPENEQNVCSGTGTCDPDNPDWTHDPDTLANGGSLAGPSSHGDPHLWTSDRIGMTFMAVGEFTALRSESGDMVVQVRQVPFGDSRWVSVNDAIALNVNRDRLTVQYSREALAWRVNGVPTALKFRVALPHGGFIVPEGRSYLVGWPDGSLARLFRNVRGVDLSMQLAPARMGTVHGLLGPFTGNQSAGIEARDGTKIRAEDVSREEAGHDRLYHAFGDSWRIAQAESLFDYAPGESTATFTDRTFPDPKPPAITPETSAAARAICVHAGVPDIALEGCILDVASTGEAGFALTTALATRAAVPTFASLPKPTANSRSVTAVVVTGTGENNYTVYDAFGKSVGIQTTNTPLELPLGNYVVEVNGTRQSLTIREGQRTSVTAGSVMVAGNGENAYTVHDGSGKSLGSRDTNVSLELLPGNYVVEVNGTRQSLTIREGQRTSVTAGSVMVGGKGEDPYTVYDGSGKSLGSRMTNVSLELLPGNYVVELNGARQSLTVRGGQRTSVTAGSVVVAGKGEDPYTVYDESGKFLGSRTTNVSLELLPGNYVVEVAGAKKSLIIRPRQQAVL